MIAHLNCVEDERTSCVTDQDKGKNVAVEVEANSKHEVMNIGDDERVWAYIALPDGDDHEESAEGNQLMREFSIH